MAEISVVDNVKPSGRWEFDQAVSDSFEDMLERSIPQYRLMRDLCLRLAAHYITANANVVDLGSSRGSAIAQMVEDSRFSSNAFIGCEVSPSMVTAAQARFSEAVDQYCQVDIRQVDLRSYYPPERAGITLSVLTLQFIPIEYRQRLLQKIFDHTDRAFILVEKVLGQTSEIDRVLVDSYYQMKSDNGYDEEAIERKRLSLEGVLVPVTAKWNEELMAMAGFKQIDCFWRCLNFAGWIAVK